MGSDASEQDELPAACDARNHTMTYDGWGAEAQPSHDLSAGPTIDSNGSAGNDDRAGSETSGEAGGGFERVDRVPGIPSDSGGVSRLEADEWVGVADDLGLRPGPRGGADESLTDAPADELDEGTLDGVEPTSLPAASEDRAPHDSSEESALTAIERLDDADDGWGVSQQPESAERTDEHVAEVGHVHELGRDVEAVREPPVYTEAPAAERNLGLSSEVDVGDRGSGAGEAVPDINDLRRAVRELIDERDRDVGAPSLDWFKSLPVTDEAIADRTSNNRISLADDVPAIASTPGYGGYLDVVMHGDESQTQADIGGQRVDFTSDQMADMIQSSDSWLREP